MIYNTTFSRHRNLWLVTNTMTNKVHSWWDSESKAVATMMDLNRWVSNSVTSAARAAADKLPDNVIPFRPRKVARSG